MPPSESSVGFDPLNHLASPSCSSSIAATVASKAPPAYHTANRRQTSSFLATARGLASIRELLQCDPASPPNTHACLALHPPPAFLLPRHRTRPTPLSRDAARRSRRSVLGRRISPKTHVPRGFIELRAPTHSPTCPVKDFTQLVIFLPFLRLHEGFWASRLASRRGKDTTTRGLTYGENTCVFLNSQGP